jgi:aminopeptidase N
MLHCQRSFSTRKNPNRLLMNLAATLLLLLITFSLAGSRPYQSTNHAYLSRQAAALRPEFRSDLEHLASAPRYTLQATVDPQSGSLTGQMTLQFTNNTSDTLSELVFRLFPNTTAIYGGGNLNVASVTEGGIALTTTLSHDHTVLHVRLQHPLKPKQAVSVDLAFNAQVPERTTQGYGIFNRALGVTSLAGWYPLLAPYDNGWQAPPVHWIGDAMWAETSLYEVMLTLPTGYQVVSTGVSVGQQTSNDGVTWHIVSGPAREFAAAISDRFQVLETQADGVTLHYYALPAQRSINSPKDGLGIMTQAFHTYVNRFGPYPFPELDMVENRVTVDGYEFSSMVEIDYVARTQSRPNDYQYFVAHEVAHQWSYGLVGDSSVYEPWLDEGFAAYSAVIYLGDTEGAQAARKILATWENAEGAHAPNDPPLNSSTLDFSSWAGYHKIVYTHAAFFLDQLRQQLGDDKFFELLKRYQATYRYQLVTTTDFLTMAQQVAGRDLSPLFSAWFATQARPKGG